MKKIVAIALSLCLIIFCLGGCSGPKSKKLAIVIPHEEENTFLNALSFYADKYVKEYKIDATIYLSDSAENQTEILNNINTGIYSTVLIYPSGEQKETVKKLKDQNLQIVYLFNKATDDYDLFYSIDETTVGKNSAQYLYSKCQELGNLKTAVIYNESDSLQTVWANNFITEASLYPVIELIGSYTLTKDSEKRTINAVKSALNKNKEINAIYCADDYIAKIAFEQIIKSKRTDIRIIMGTGGKSEYLKLFNNNDYILVSSNYSPVIMRDCLLSIKNLMDGKKVNKDTIISSNIIDNANANIYANEEAGY